MYLCIKINHQLLGQSGSSKALEVVLKTAVVVDILDVATIRDDTTRGTGLLVLGTGKLGEAPLVRDEQLLATRELVLGTAESLNDNSLVGILGTDGNQGLANGNTGNGTIRLTESTSHTSLQTIGTSAGQHLVDTQDVERMDTNAKMEGVLTAGLGDVLVGTDTGSLKRLAGNLLNLIRHHVDAKRELISSSLLTTKIEDLNLRVGDTTAEARLGVRLVLAVAIATSRTATHLSKRNNWMD